MKLRVAGSNPTASKTTWSPVTVNVDYDDYDDDYYYECRGLWWSKAHLRAGEPGWSCSASLGLKRRRWGRKTTTCFSSTLNSKLLQCCWRSEGLMILFLSQRKSLGIKVSKMKLLMKVTMHSKLEITSNTNKSWFSVFILLCFQKVCARDLIPEDNPNKKSHFDKVGKSENTQPFIALYIFDH